MQASKDPGFWRRISRNASAFPGRIGRHHAALIQKKQKAGKLTAENSAGRKLMGFPVNKYLMLAIAAMVLLSFVFFTNQIFKIVIFVVMLVLASYSTVYKRKLGMPLGGVELVTFGTVLTGVAYGPWAGLIFGIVSSTASEIISAGLGPTTWIYVLTMGGVGVVSGHVYPLVPILLLGMLATAALLAINQLIFFVVGDPEVKTFTMFYIIANLIFNFLMFSTLSGRIMTVLTLSI